MRAPLASATVREFDETTEGVDQHHVLDRMAARLEKPRRADEQRQALRPRDGHVETVARKEEPDVSGHVLAARGGHGAEHDGSLLSLELVDGADPHALRK